VYAGNRLAAAIEITTNQRLSFGTDFP